MVPGLTVPVRQPEALIKSAAVTGAGARSVGARRRAACPRMRHRGGAASVRWSRLAGVVG
jgi:hypothetical protein